MPYKNKKIILNGEEYANKSISQIEKEIESILTIKAGTEEETLELKLRSIRELPNFINDSGLRYKKYFDINTLEVWYEEI